MKFLPKNEKKSTNYLVHSNLSNFLTKLTEQEEVHVLQGLEIPNAKLCSDLNI